MSPSEASEVPPRRATGSTRRGRCDSRSRLDATRAPSRPPRQPDKRRGRRSCSTARDSKCASAAGTLGGAARFGFIAVTQSSANSFTCRGRGLEPMFISATRPRQTVVTTSSPVARMLVSASRISVLLRAKCGGECVVIMKYDAVRGCVRRWRRDSRSRRSEGGLPGQSTGDRLPA